jgi:hypothetical protein
MESKCPVCQKGRLYEYFKHTSKECLCRSCMFSCDIIYLPRIAAAMELARAAVSMWTDELAMDPEKEYLTAKRSVIEVFGGE